jgi:flagellar basal body P-ring formation protein FlgA
VQRKALTALFALALSGLAPAPVAAGVTVRVAAEATVHGNEIALGDVATVQGDDALARRLRKLVIGPAPLPGASQRLDPGYLRLRLGEAQLEPSKVNLVVPDEVVVTRAFQVLTGAAIVDAASREVRQRLEAQPGARGPWAVVAASRPADLRVPEGSVEMIAQVQGDPSTHSSLGATVAIKVDGRPFQTVPLSLRVGRYQDVVVVARPLDGRSPLTAGDLRVEPRPSTDIPEGALSSLPDLSDADLTRPMREGELVTAAVIRRRVIVKRGELVTLLLEGPGFRIVAQGVASTDARRGDMVKVMNATSKREAVGKVDGPGVVRVLFADLGRDR